MSGKVSILNPLRLTKQNTYFRLALPSCFFFTCFILFIRTGLFFDPDASLLSHEIDLSGAWKIKLEDKAEYKNAKFDDKDWCEIGVPDGYLIPKGAQKGLCKDFWYDRSKFRDKTFWYRKTFSVPDPNAFKEPSLFLGSIKRKAWVYLNGKEIAIVHREDLPIIVSLGSNYLQPGTNRLSVRVQSGNDQYPGLFSGLLRGAVIGEYERNILVRKQTAREYYVEAVLTLIIQLSCLLMSLFLVYYGIGLTSKFTWLSIYFASSAFLCLGMLYFWQENENQNTRYLLDSLSNLGLLISSFGYAIETFVLPQGAKQTIKTISQILLVTLIIFFASNITFNLGYDEPLNFVLKVVCLSSFLTVFANWLFVWRKGHEAKLALTDLIISTLLTVVSVALVLEHFILATRSPFIRMQLLTSFVSFGIMFLVSREYILNNKALAFFGRFIRPGLKQMLFELGDRLVLERKLFRGRKTILVKLDIVGHTKLTYKMPYGIKRLFQDLWFSKIDSLFSRFSYVDKNQGDGSIYCIDERADTKICTNTLLTVLSIRDRFSCDFWREFAHEVSLLLKREPTLNQPFQQFLKQYEIDHGNSFFEEAIQIYAVLVFGFVDEGLWGLTSQSHYDVQGNLVTLASRIENEAEANEILIDRAFYGRMLSENSVFDSDHFLWKKLNLRGLGEFEVGEVKGSLPANSWPHNISDGRTN